MPDDYLEQELARRRAELDRVTEEQAPDVQGLTSRTEQGRSRFYREALAPFQAVGGDRALQAELSRVSGGLQSRLARNVQARTMQSVRDRVSRRYENAIRRAADSGASAQEAVAFARQEAMDEARRSYQAEQSAAERGSALARADIRQQAASEINALQEQFQPGSPYEAALYRSLFGLAGTIGAAGVMRARSSIPTPLPQSSFGYAYPSGTRFARDYVAFPSNIPQYRGGNF